MCLIVTDEVFLRGFDYGVNPAQAHDDIDGIDMLFMRKVGSTRGLIQAYNRVGRYNESCTHYKLPGLDNLVDESQMLATFFASKGK